MCLALLSKYLFGQDVGNSVERGHFLAGAALRRWEVRGQSKVWPLLPPRPEMRFLVSVTKQLR